MPVVKDSILAEKENARSCLHMIWLIKQTWKQK